RRGEPLRNSARGSLTRGGRLFAAGWLGQEQPEADAADAVLGGQVRQRALLLLDADLPDAQDQLAGLLRLRRLEALAAGLQPLEPEVAEAHEHAVQLLAAGLGLDRLVGLGLGLVGHEVGARLGLGLGLGVALALAVGLDRAGVRLGPATTDARVLLT